MNIPTQGHIKRGFGTMADIDRQWLCSSQNLVRALEVVNSKAPKSGDVIDLKIRAMHDLGTSPCVPVEYFSIAMHLVPDGSWGTNAQAAYAMLSYIAKHGEVPEHDFDDSSDSDVRLDTSAATQPDDEEPIVFDQGAPKRQA